MGLLLPGGIESFGMNRRRLRAATCLTGVAATIGVLCLQWALGAWSAGWAGEPDAPAHLTSSLVLRQYALEGLPSLKPPLEFAYSFYHRFPKVGLGHWPPIFHSTLALWLLPGPLHPVWILGFQALAAGILAALTFLLVKPLLGVRRAAACSLMALLSPPLVRIECLVMPDILAAIFMLCGLLAFRRYWRQPAVAPALLFGFSLTAALYTKPTGAILALVPFLAVLLLRRWSLLRQCSYWLLFALPFVLYGPWHFYFLNEMNDGWIYPERYFTLFVATPLTNLSLLALTAGWFGFPFAVWCAWKNRRRRDWWLLAFSALAGFVFLAYIAPSRGLRHHCIIAPVVIALAAGGFRAIARRSRRLLEPACWLVLAGSLFFAASSPARDFGTRRLVARLLGSPAPQTWLVAGDSGFEGDVIAEAALHRPSAGLTVYRASKLITSSSWSGFNLKLMVHSIEDTRRLLDRSLIGVIILGHRSPEILVRAVNAHPSIWKLRPGALPASTGSVYERAAPPLPGLGDPVVQIP